LPTGTEGGGEEKESVPEISAPLAPVTDPPDRSELERIWVALKSIDWGGDVIVGVIWVALTVMSPDTE
jgi:hypothetical protein